MSTREFTRALAPVTVVDPEEPEAESMYARDIGLGGLFLYTEKRWPQGSEVELVIEYGTKSIPVAVRVLRFEDDGVAFAFDKPISKVRQEIRGLLAYLFATGAESDERRGRRRRDVANDVLWMADGKEYRGHLEDISLESARIAAQEKPTLETIISVFLPVRAGKRIDDLRGSSARVVRHSDTSFAVKFIDAGVSFHEAIAMLVTD